MLPHVYIIPLTPIPEKGGYSDEPYDGHIWTPFPSTNDVLIGGGQSMQHQKKQWVRPGKCPPPR